MKLFEKRPRDGVTQLWTNEEQQTFNGKTNEVYSVALADAIAKDNQSMLSRNMIKLYVIMVLVTMSK